VLLRLPTNPPLPPRLTYYSPHGAQTTYAYTNSPPTVKATIDVDDRWTLSTMDGLGRTVKVEQGDSTGTTKSVVRWSSYRAAIGEEQAAVWLMSRRCCGV
jgi:hypothetical protein